LLTIAADGEPQLAAGQWDTPMFPRSSNKPMQAAGMLRSGLDTDGRLLALAAASHSGEDFHVAGVREILAGAGLTEDDLRCPRSLPREEVFKQEYLRQGGEPDQVHMNCSGKHAAMLATCVAAGWPTATYTDPGHPLQVALRQTVEDLAAEPSAAVGVDGCGAPVFALSLAGLARATELLMLAEPVPADRALSLGLLNSVVDGQDLAAAARDLAGRLAAGPTAAYAAIKEGLAYAATHDLADSLEMEAQLQARLAQTHDHAAATQAFLRKQPPAYQGS